MKDGKEKYSAYLCSREWSVLKEEVKLRSGGICERCLVNPMDHVHHLTYKRKYAERLEDLQACCMHCHEFIHAKSHTDPAVNRPAVIPWCRSRVKSVYLAGKITGTNWRSSIVPDWDYENHSRTYRQAFTEYDQDKLWSSVPNACVACDGILLHYAGPWWCDPWGHGSADQSAFPHGYGVDLGDEGVGGVHDVDDCQLEVAKAVSHAINVADLIFAWLDSNDCFGTLVELGLARGLGKVVVLATSNHFDASELWLAKAASNYSLEAATAGEAWHKFWRIVSHANANPSLEEEATDGTPVS
jgi:hypothetical protein